MGKGDLKTRKGKIFNHSYGVKRPRKKKKKSILIRTPIITDTNIWYYLGKLNESDFNKYRKLKLIPNYINIKELSTTGYISEKPELVRNAIRRIFSFQENTLFAPPFIYLVEEINHISIFNPRKDIGDILTFTTQFAKGAKINEKHNKDFEKWVKEKKEHSKKLSDLINNYAEEIKQEYSKDELMSKNTLSATLEFIKNIAKSATENKYNIDCIECSKIELLLKTLDLFLKKLVITNMKCKPNDLYDFALLAYVKPGTLFWTHEIRWQKLIEEAGCSKYLYNSL